jgi:hypothetical protein
MGADMTRQNHYTVNFTDGTSLTAHGDSAPAVFDLWKSQEQRIGKTVKNVYLYVDETESNSASRQ